MIFRQMCFEFIRGVARDMGYQMSIVIVWLKCGEVRKIILGCCYRDKITAER